ncbi:hypothetical protein CEXT_777191 [Caerostris extrusa]|uniref:Uncharacterized protein n=1 Tax=Caerostris extrusa TaxID=172846 RepID=A0AAV4V5F6_CAEEX|nr:hypothetical protein CEXT_777191 [Caerostris extrusa]
MTEKHLLCQYLKKIFNHCKYRNRKLYTGKQTEETEMEEPITKEQITTTSAFESSEIKTFGTESPKIETESTTKEERLTSIGVDITEKISSVSEEKTASTLSDEIEKLTTEKQTEKTELTEHVTKEHLTTAFTFEPSEKLSTEIKAFVTESPKVEDESTTKEVRVASDGVEITEKTSPIYEEKLHPL